MSDRLKNIASPVRSLPKTDMHLHIEGSIALDEYRQVVTTPEGWTPPGWAADFRYHDFADFESFILDYADKWFVSPERYHESARSLFRRKLEEGVRYLECSFASIVCQAQGLSTEAVAAAVREAVPDGLEVRIFIGLHHESGFPGLEKLLEGVLASKVLDGIDLHGPEGYPVRDWMLDFWPAAREAGLFTKAHAGELGGAWHVREAVEKLGVRRVEHGFRATDDPEVLALLVEHGVVLDLCPISNYKLLTVPDYETHPLPRLIEAGVVCTLNTDDPFIFGNTIDDEFSAVAERCGIDTPTLISLARNGFENALVDEATRSAMLAEFDAAVRKIGDETK